MQRGKEVGKGGETLKMSAGLDFHSHLKRLGIQCAHFWGISGNFSISFSSLSGEHQCWCASLHSHVSSGGSGPTSRSCSSSIDMKVYCCFLGCQSFPCGNHFLNRITV